METSEAKERLRNLEMEIYNMIAAFEEETNTAGLRYGGL